jgi:hypothetical protein
MPALDSNTDHLITVPMIIRIMNFLRWIKANYAINNTNVQTNMYKRT